MRLTRFVHAVRASLWLVPLLCVLAGVLIAFGTLWLDRQSGYTLVPQSVTGTPTDAQTTLSASYMCRSHPQMFADVIRTRTSVGRSMRASGTSLTLTCRGPS